MKHVWSLFKGVNAVPSANLLSTRHWTTIMTSVGCQNYPCTQTCFESTESPFHSSRKGVRRCRLIKKDENDKESLISKRSIGKYTTTIFRNRISQTREMQYIFFLSAEEVPVLNFRNVLWKTNEIFKEVCDGEKKGNTDTTW